jgi:anti-anti-sigma factor
MDFSIVATGASGRWTLRLGGVIEKFAARRLERALEEACAAEAREIVLDIAGVSFVDRAGVQALVHGRTFCTGRGCRLTVSPVFQPAVRRLFDLADVWRELDLAGQAEDRLREEAR